MKNTEIRTKTDKLLTFISEKFHRGELDNQSLVEIIQLAGAYLNLQTIADYARNNQISYEGARRCRFTKEFFGVKFVVDNI